MLIPTEVPAVHTPHFKDAPPSAWRQLRLALWTPSLLYPFKEIPEFDHWCLLDCSIKNIALLLSKRVSETGGKLLGPRDPLKLAA